MEPISPAVPTATRTPRQALPYDSLGTDVPSMKEGMLRHLEYTLAELPRHVDSEWEPYLALALAVRDRMVQRWVPVPIQASSLGPFSRSWTLRALSGSA